MSFAIFGIILAVVTIFCLFLVFTKMNGTFGKIALTIVVLVAALVVGIIGSAAFGTKALVDTVKDDLAKQEKEGMLGEPKNQNNEKLDVFAQTDTVKGNGFEISSLKTVKFTDGLSGKFFDKTNFCGVELKVKNLGRNNENFGTYKTEFQNSKSEVFFPFGVFTDPDNKKYEAKTFDLAPEQEVSMYVFTECKNSPTLFVVKDYKFDLLEKTKPRDIKFKVAF